MPDVTDGAAGGLALLAIAMALFVGSHLLLSAPPLRTPLVERLGEGGFRIAYSTIALGLIVWVVVRYNAAPVIDFWLPPIALKHLSLTLMPIACILLVAGVTTANPTAIGPAPEAAAARGPVGISRVTRHPVMWAFALWGISHLLANGDAAGFILFGGITLLALGGARAQEAKKRAQQGQAWETYAGQTSFLPFAAVIAGRTRLRWSEIGWWRVGLGLALYGLLLWAHPWLFGVSPLPL
jgi:uncharacterized membrane protein